MLPSDIIEAIDNLLRAQGIVISHVLKHPWVTHAVAQPSFEAYLRDGACVPCGARGNLGHLEHQ